MKKQLVSDCSSSQCPWPPDDPNPAIELLTGFDDEEAHEIALMIHQKNEERKEDCPSYL